MSTTHRLKTHPPYFAAVNVGCKTFEIRSTADRTFREADVLILEEWDPEAKAYTGNTCTRVVSYVLKDGPFAIPGHAVLGLLEPMTDLHEDALDAQRAATRAVIDSLTPRPYPPTVDDVRWLQNGKQSWCDIVILLPGDYRPLVGVCTLDEPPDVLLVGNRPVSPPPVLVVVGAQNNPTLPKGTRYMGIRGNELVPWPVTIPTTAS